MAFRSPVSKQLKDPDVEQLRRNHEERIRELQTALTMWPPGKGIYLGRQRFAASGLYTPAIGAKQAVVMLAGGGGGGGGGTGGAGTASTGAGGSGGAFVLVSISSPTQLTGGAVVIGAGGAGGAAGNNAGAAGGDSSITINGITYTARGGPGGGGQPAQGSIGFAFPGQLNASASSAGDAPASQEGGQPGIVVNNNLFWGGSGGRCGNLGAGGYGANGSNPGGNAQGAGGGGGGACCSTVSQAGGNGAAGLCLVFEYGG